MAMVQSAQEEKCGHKMNRGLTVFRLERFFTLERTFFTGIYTCDELVL